MTLAALRPKLSRRAFFRARTILYLEAIRELTAELGRAPTVEQMAARLGVGTEAVRLKCWRLYAEGLAVVKTTVEVR